jgi:hypothetical protein
MTTYTMMHVLMASPTKPLPEHKRQFQLTRMFDAMRNLETADSPTSQDWERVNDAVMLMEALRDMNIVEDSQGLLEDAMEALGKAGDRSLNGKTMRLDGKGIQALRGLLEDYAEVLEVLPERTMLAAHRKAETRILKLMGRK